MSSQRPIRRALISVYDKTGLTELACGLYASGTVIVSTGSTAAAITNAGVPVTQVAELTGFPECLDGRVKTLHPRVHAGILADQHNAAHRAQLAELDIESFDLVVVNLYPFSETVAAGHDFPECIEKIDIGGPTMVRAAAKNHASVAVLTNPGDYAQALRAARHGGFTGEQRQELAAAAFAHTATYDLAVAQWFADQAQPDSDSPEATDAVPTGSGFPAFWGLGQHKLKDLRYGENPHQAAAIYGEENGVGIAAATLVSGKEMSFNNYQDIDAAWRAAHDFTQPAVAIIKHANPCGIASADTIAQAHAKAHACDPLSAYGGVIAANREVDAELAAELKLIFTEVVAAPSFTAEALEILSTKKNLRLLQVNSSEAPLTETKQISGGMLVQQRDLIDAPGDAAQSWSLVAGGAADPDTLADLEFAWRACRAVKSNAIVLAHDGATVGIGMGQVNRVDSAKLAVSRAGAERSAGSVGASDAFFPFADGAEILFAAGVKAIVQPGGSVRDAEVIAAATAAGVSMYFTGTRHFFH